MNSNLNISSTLTPLSPSTSHLLSMIFTTSYVGSIYLSQHVPLPKSLRQRQILKSKSKSKPITTPNGCSDTEKEIVLPPISSTDEKDISPSYPPVGSRDHPLTIKRRMTAVGLSSFLSLGGVWYTISKTSTSTFGKTLWPTLKLLGLCLPTPSGRGQGPILPYILAPTLLLGPLISMYLDGDFSSSPSLSNNEYGNGETIFGRVKRKWNEFGLIELRNYVVGPVTEELVFRSTILAVSIMGRLPFKSLVFGTPLWFGIAHAHHALEVYRKGGSTRSAAIQALLGSLFQLTYTTLFGWFASYLYLRTGSVLPPLTAHVYCNMMGIYLPTTAVARHPRQKALIWTSYLVGVAGFIYGLRKL